MNKLLRSLLNRTKPQVAPIEEPATCDQSKKIKSTRQAPPKFRTEQEMKVYYAKNLDEIEPGLRLYTKGKWVGVEVPCGFSERGLSGLIDILAEDRSGDLVVIECKLQIGNAAAFGQILGYVAWLQAWLRNEVKTRRMSKLPRVRAVILCKRASAMLRFLLISYHEFDVTLFEMEPKPSVVPSRR